MRCDGDILEVVKRTIGWLWSDELRLLGQGHLEDDLVAQGLDRCLRARLWPLEGTARVILVVLSFLRIVEGELEEHWVDLLELR